MKIMKADIKEKIKKEKMMRELSNDHRSVFEKKLQKELHSSSAGTFQYLMIAASVVVLLKNYRHPVRKCHWKSFPLN